MKVASMISLISSAPMISSFTFLLLILSTTQSELPLILFVSVLFSTVIPLGILFMFSKQRLIPDLWASSRGTRWMPFAGAVVSYLLGSTVLVLMRAPAVVVSLMLFYLGNSLIMMVITLRWKIGVHASGIAGPTTVLVYSLGFAASLISLLLIPAGWARLRVKAHTFGQFLAGALLTVITTWVQLVYLRFL